MSYLGVGISLGNVPVSHSINVNVVDRRVRVAKLVLRCVICGLGVLDDVDDDFRGREMTTSFPLNVFLFSFFCFLQIFF